MGTTLFSKADASITGTSDPGLILLSAHLRDGVSVEEAEEAVTDSALSLIASPPSAHELERVLNRFEASHMFGTLGYANLASALAQCEARGEDINDVVPRQRTVTTDAIVNAVSAYITPANSSTLIYSPRQ